MLDLFRTQTTEEQTQPLGLFKQETATDFLNQTISKLMKAKEVKPSMELQALQTMLNGWITESQALTILKTLVEQRGEIIDLIDEVADDAEQWLQKRQ